MHQTGVPDERPPQKRSLNWIYFLLAAIITFSLTVLFTPHTFFIQSDAFNYLAIARGQAMLVEPFASRQFAPTLARLIAFSFHLTVERSFILQGLLSLAVLAGVTFRLLYRASAPAWLLLVLIPLPFWKMIFTDLALPDLFYAALLALLFWAISRSSLISAAAMFLPLALTRETTLLVLVCFLAVGFRQTTRRACILALIFFMAGSMLVRYWTPEAAANREHLPKMAYMLAKMPWNFSRNILGIIPWSNVYPLLCSTPTYSVPLEFGPVHAVGVCGFNKFAFFSVLHCSFDVFGILPVLGVFLFLRVKRPYDNFLLLFSLIYGAVSFLLAPMLGVSLDRLFGYAWPLFLLAIPLLLERLSFEHVNRPEFFEQWSPWALVFVVLNLACCELGYRDHYVLETILQIVLSILGYLVLLRWWHAGRTGPATDTLKLNPSTNLNRSQTHN